MKIRVAEFLRSVKGRFVLWGVLLVVLGGTLRMMVSLPYMRDQVEQLVAGQQQSIASYIARDVAYSIQSRLMLIEQLAGELDPSLLTRPARLQEWLKERQKHNPLFNSGLLLVPVDGRGTLAEYPVVAGRSALDYRQSDWFLLATRSTRAVMGRPMRGRVTGDPLIMMAAPVRNAEGEVVAVIAGVALINAPGFLDRLQETRLGATGGFLLISPQDQLFVAASDPGMVLRPTPPPGVNLLHDRAMAGYRGTGVTINAQGVEELSAMVSVPGIDWFVVARMPTAEAFRPVESMRRFFLQNSVVVLVVLLLILLPILTYLLRPLTRASDAIHAMAEGRRELEELPEGRADEVGQLVRGFNQLVRRLREKENALLASESRLAFLAQHDPLTGLPNRSLFEDRFSQALKRSERQGTELAVLFCDLDGFKLINDLHGHQVGDAVLTEVAARLSAGRRAQDTVARFGGDEFVLLLSDQDDARAAAQWVGEQCLQAVAQPYVIDGMEMVLGVSIGVATHRGGGSAAHLLTLADAAMYQAKRAGKGRLVFVTEEGEGSPVFLASSNPENHS